MSDFDPPTPDDPPPLQARKDNEARLLENALSEYALKLGMKIRVAADMTKWCFHIYGRLLSPAERHSVDEEILLSMYAPVGHVPASGRTLYTGAADLLQQILEDLQCKLHDNMAAAMQKNDVRQRKYVLSREDKNALHKLLWLASKGMNSIYPDFERDKKAFDAARAVLDKLFA